MTYKEEPLKLPAPTPHHSTVTSYLLPRLLCGKPQGTSRPFSGKKLLSQGAHFKTRALALICQRGKGIT